MILQGETIVDVYAPKAIFQTVTNGCKRDTKSMMVEMGDLNPPLSWVNRLTTKTQQETSELICTMDQIDLIYVKLASFLSVYGTLSRIDQITGHEIQKLKSYHVSFLIITNKTGNQQLKKLQKISRYMETEQHTTE